MIIKLQVQHQRIQGAKQLSRLVIEHSRSFVYLDMEFDEEWDNLTTHVIFTNDHCGGESPALLWTGEPLAVPPEVLVTGTLRISCVGVGNKGLYLTTLYMSDGIQIYRSGELSGYTPGSSVPGMWEQVLATVGSLTALETENKESIVGAVNEIHGRAIQSIEQTLFADKDGGVNEFTVTLFDGSTTVLQVLNGNTGAHGKSPIIGENGNWYVYNDESESYEDTGSYSGGEAPYIGANGNWWIGTNDSGVSATGPAGPAGERGEPGFAVDVEYDEDTGTVAIVNGEGGEGSGVSGMDAAIYDPDGSVAAAGGIAQYVADNMPEAEPGGTQTTVSAVLTVNVTDSGGTLTADKTYAEIQEAAQAGKVVQARYGGNTYTLSYADPADVYLDFNHIWGRYLKTLEVTNENAVRHVIQAFVTG